LNAFTAKSEQKERINSELEWRQSLKTGDKVDIVKTVSIRDLKMSAWNRGTVIWVSQPEDSESGSPKIKVDIQYENDKDALQKRLDISDWRIAPLGTFTEDWNWRYEIKLGDVLDCLDEEKDWYKSTVLKTRVGTNQQGEEIQEIYVGFRTYEEEGSKEDDSGKKFFGWSEKYDTWYGVTDVQV